MLNILIIFCSIGVYGQNEKVLCNAPNVNFEMETFCFGQTTVFKNKTLSSQKPTYLWKIFKTGESAPTFTSSQIDISYFFPEIGTYTVVLIAANPDLHATTLERVLKVDTALRANFEYINCGTYFTNNSGCADTYVWDFGDTTYSTIAAPFKEYKHYGLAKVKLVAKKGNRKDSLEKMVLVIPRGITGKFGVLKNSDTLLFKSYDTIGTGTQEYYWSWGDGTNTSTFGNSGIIQKKVYKKIGRDTTYKVFLLVKNTCYQGYSSQDVFIRDSTIINGTHLFPNPLLPSNLLRLLTEREEEISNISVRNFAGVPITQLQFFIKPNGVDIDLSDVPAGVYFVQFMLGKEQKTYKIIKK